MTTRTPSAPSRSSLAAPLALAPAAFAAKRKTETIRFFSKPVSFTYTSVDGTVTHGPPAGPPQAGDVFEIDSLDYAATTRSTPSRPTMSDYLRCTFTAEPRARLLRLRRDRRLAAALPRLGPHRRHRPLEGRRQGVSNKEVEGGSDFVVRVKLR